MAAPIGSSPKNQTYPVPKEGEGELEPQVEGGWFSEFINGRQDTLERVKNGAAFGVGFTGASFILYKVYNVVTSAAAGAEAGAAAGAPFGPQVAVVASVAGGAMGAIKGIVF